MAESFTSTDVLFYEAKRTAKQQLDLSKGDFVVITGGNPNGSTNLIKVEKI
jgi:pyruvate kinase